MGQAKSYVGYTLEDRIRTVSTINIYGILSSISCANCPQNYESKVLVSASSARVGSVLAAEQGGVSHAAIVGVHVNLGPHAAGLTKLCPSFHL